MIIAKDKIKMRLTAVIVGLICGKRIEKDFNLSPRTMEYLLTIEELMDDEANLSERDIKVVQKKMKNVKRETVLPHITCIKNAILYLRGEKQQFLEALKRLTTFNVRYLGVQTLITFKIESEGAYLDQLADSLKNFAYERSRIYQERTEITEFTQDLQNKLLQEESSLDELKNDLTQDLITMQTERDNLLQDAEVLMERYKRLINLKSGNTKITLPVPSIENDVVMVRLMKLEGILRDLSSYRVSLRGDYHDILTDIAAFFVKGAELLEADFGSDWLARSAKLLNLRNSLASDLNYPPGIGIWRENTICDIIMSHTAKKDLLGFSKQEQERTKTTVAKILTTGGNSPGLRTELWSGGSSSKSWKDNLKEPPTNLAQSIKVSWITDSLRIIWMFTGEERKRSSLSILNIIRVSKERWKNQHGRGKTMAIKFT